MIKLPKNSLHTFPDVSCRVKHDILSKRSMLVVSEETGGKKEVNPVNCKLAPGADPSPPASPLTAYNTRTTESRPLCFIVLYRSRYQMELKEDEADEGTKELTSRGYYNLYIKIDTVYEYKGTIIHYIDFTMSHDS